MRIILLFFFFYFSCYFAVAQSKSEEVDDGVKVGVVLSGGGAKGVAHVGVLRMIEKAGVRVDYIGGTSMGAIVSALYSIGYSVDELDSIISVLDMSKLVQGKIPRNNLTYFEKTFDSETFLSVPVNNWEIGIPKGLSNGQDVIEEFTELTREYPGHQDFDKLPIPLVMMATDIVTGESIEFHEGSIPMVMRASSSFPSLFSPIEIDGRLLVDGGVLNNFPVKEVRSMGADIIIGVSVEDGLYKKKDLMSITSIIEQISSFKMVEKSEKQAKLVDVYIKPDISDYSVVSFDKAGELLELGEIEGFKYFNELLDIAKRQKPSSSDKRKPLINTVNYNISSVEVKDSRNHSTEYFTDRFPVKKLPGLINIDQIKAGINTLDGTRNFDFIGYDLMPDGKGWHKLVIKVKEKRNNDYLKLGLHYDEIYKAGLKLKFTARNKFLRSSIFMSDIIISDRPRLNILFYKDNAAWPGFLLQSNFTQFEVDMPAAALGDLGDLISGSIIDMKYKDWTTKVMAQKTINEDFYFAGGVEAKRLAMYSSSLKVMDKDGDFEERPFVFDEGWSINPLLEIYADTRDNSNYPTRGFLFKSEFKVVIPQSQNNDLKENTLVTSSFLYLRADYTFSPSERLAWTNKIYSSTRFGSGSTAGLSYYFGGYNKNLPNNVYSFFGYPVFGVVGVEDGGFFKYLTSLQYRIIQDIYITGHANYMIAAKNSNQWYEAKKLHYSGYALSLGYNSKIGPVEFTSSYSPDNGKFSFMFNLGYWF
ncbi:MAG: patatin-like phospholipase family protein [Bacteroidota bacterium]